MFHSSLHSILRFGTWLSNVSPCNMALLRISPLFRSLVTCCLFALLSRLDFLESCGLYAVCTPFMTSKCTERVCEGLPLQLRAFCFEDLSVLWRAFLSEDSTVCSWTELQSRFTCLKLDPTVMLDSAIFPGNTMCRTLVLSGFHTLPRSCVFDSRCNAELSRKRKFVCRSSGSVEKQYVVLFLQCRATREHVFVFSGLHIPLTRHTTRQKT